MVSHSPFKINETRKKKSKKKNNNRGLGRTTTEGAERRDISLACWFLMDKSTGRRRHHVPIITLVLKLYK